MKKWDIFISHASEDKDNVAFPLARLLERRGARVWFDSQEIGLGDSLREKLDEGLARSRFGVVVLSPVFLRKVWTNRELSGFLAREEGGNKVLLPIWHDLDKVTLSEHSPLLADRVAVSTSDGLSSVADKIIDAVFYRDVCEEGERPLARRIVECLGEVRTIRQFLAHHPRVLVSALGGYSDSAEVFIQPYIGPMMRPDFCVGLERPTPMDLVWTVVCLANPGRSPIGDQGQLVRSTATLVSNLDRLLCWVVANPRNEPESMYGLAGRTYERDPNDYDPKDADIPPGCGIVFVGQRGLLTPDQKATLRGINASLRRKRIEIRTYDALIDACRRVTDEEQPMVKGSLDTER